MKQILSLSFFTCVCLFTLSQRLLAQQQVLSSPDHNISVQLSSPGDPNALWSFKVQYKDNTTVFPAIGLGLLRQDADFAHNLKLRGVGKTQPVHEQYVALHGKKSVCTNDGNEVTVQFITVDKKEMDVILRVYNNGIAFRYTFPEKKAGQYKMLNELTTYHIADSSKRWMQSFVRSYEGFYPEQDNAFKAGEWGYPALFNPPGATECWALITEANLDRNYCATKLTNTAANASEYKLTFPSAGDGNSTGDVNPVFSLPWQSPWRVVIIGQLKDVVQSTLVEDVSEPQIAGNFNWVQPGISSWVYWAYNHGTKDYQRLCQYTDLAARMGWKYTLFDWEWDQMSNGGDVEKAVQYALAKGVKPLIWYNSGGNHNTVPATPKDRLITKESRAKEFEWLSKIGIYGIKVDFFESDKQNIINYYIDLMEDAAKYKLMIYFHGATVPRGWSRTYPNLMTIEGVAGAEQYNNGPVMTAEGARHNATLPFTRNIIGPMDYTPVAFTNSQHAHTTTFAHELALSVLFESGIQHFADRPSGFENLPPTEKMFLSRVPASWDDTRFISGYPGKSTIIARQKGKQWFIGGINGQNRGGQTAIDFSFLPTGKKYRLTLINDGDNDMAFHEQYMAVESTDKIQVSWLPRGGFAGYIEEF
ncbi:glycoside hydrolase family 97 protein [Mucilaginibacter ginsenosidivorax]|uniref:Glycoside hydrolase family 97 protein n=1 Tax=Mucilaginibacter ginsenosidivorax TaxID=862126 RepID=A0A5B8W611_9SPHI|nr:glycoside hydrolase family 97 protein [Mucilaginibacter ginsenosidivorax]QEC79490.1 glycoside hydrolase family 97 protein [Mucilaginibacter ginsenosidivorax]